MTMMESKSPSKQNETQQIHLKISKNIELANKSEGFKTVNSNTFKTDRKPQVRLTSKFDNKLNDKTPRPYSLLAELTSKFTSSSLNVYENKDCDDNILDLLKRQLNELISLCNNFMDKYLSRSNLRLFLQKCQDARFKMDQFIHADKKRPVMLDNTNKPILEKLKTNICDVVDEIEGLKDKIKFTPSIQSFLKMSKEAQIKLNAYVTQGYTPQTSDRIRQIKQHIAAVNNLTQEYRNQGIMKPALKEFLERCEHFKGRLDSYTNKEQNNDEKKRMDDLNIKVCDIHEIASSIKTELSKSIEAFISACNDFKKKLGEFRYNNKPLSSNPEVNKLVRQIDDAINLSTEAKNKGFLLKSVDDLVKPCDGNEEYFQKKHTERRYEKSNEVNHSGLLHQLKGTKTSTANSLSEGIVAHNAENFNISKDTAISKKNSESNELQRSIIFSSNPFIHQDQLDSIVLEREDIMSCKSKNIANITPKIHKIFQKIPQPVSSQRVVYRSYSHTKEKSPEELAIVHSFLSIFIEPFIETCETQDIGEYTPPSQSKSDLSILDHKNEEIEETKRLFINDEITKKENDIITIKRHNKPNVECYCNYIDFKGGTSDYSLIVSNEDISDVSDLSHQDYIMQPFRNALSEIMLRVTSYTELTLRQCISIIIDKTKDDNSQTLNDPNMVIL